MECNNIWGLVGDCEGNVSAYRVWDSEGKNFYDWETKEPFEKSGFSIRGALEVRGPKQIQAIVTPHCDAHARELTYRHPNLELALSGLSEMFEEKAKRQTTNQSEKEAQAASFTLAARDGGSAIPRMASSAGRTQSAIRIFWGCTRDAVAPND